MAEIIDGKLVAGEIRKQIAQKVTHLKSKGTTPGLAAILVGDEPASQVYVSNKEKACREVGIFSEVIKLKTDISQELLIDKICELNDRKDIHAILVQLPLPSHLDEFELLRNIHPAKDVDGFHPFNQGLLLLGRKTFVPCTPAGIIELLRYYQVEILGKRAVVVGRSNIVGKPVSLLLLQEHATVTICHTRTKDLASETRAADILIVAAGKPGVVTGDMVKEGAVVIDVGIHRIDGKLIGDVDFESAAKKAAFITPVPGGVGPMTIAMLLKNTLQACEGLTLA